MTTTWTDTSGTTVTQSLADQAAASATAAATSETNAAASETAAAASATSASTDAATASTAATNAAASYDSFDDTYLGAKSSEPVTDNDGDALVTGALFYDTTATAMKVYTGSAWAVAYVSDGGALQATNNLSDLNSASTARANLGLGTIATQAANSVDIDGGAIDGAVIGANTAAAATFTTIQANSDVTVTGDLTVNGTTTTVNSTTVTTADNIVVVNDGEVGAGVTAGSAGIEVERGTATNYQFVFVESDDSFKIGESGSLQKVATREDTPTDNAFAFWDTSTSKLETSANFTYNGTTFTVGDDWDFNDQLVSKPELKDYAETAVSANTGTAYTVDLTNGNVFDLTLTGNCIFTFSNPPASGKAGTITMILTQDGTGSRTASWPASVDWPGGTAPTLTTTATTGVDVLTFLTVDGGTTWFGFVAGQEFS